MKEIIKSGWVEFRMKYIRENLLRRLIEKEKLEKDSN